MLPMNFTAVLTTFSSPHTVTVFDTVGEYINGDWTISEETPREYPIQAIVLVMNPLMLEQYKEGDSSASGITLHTQATLYFTDISTAGQQTKQSYVTYQGYTFKVVGTGFMLGNTNLNIYSAVRHLT